MPGEFDALTWNSLRVQVDVSAIDPAAHQVMKQDTDKLQQVIEDALVDGLGEHIGGSWLCLVSVKRMVE